MELSPETLELIEKELELKKLRKKANEIEEKAGLNGIKAKRYTRKPKIETPTPKEVEKEEIIEIQEDIKKDLPNRSEELLEKLTTDMVSVKEYIELKKEQQKIKQDEIQKKRQEIKKPKPEPKTIQEVLIDEKIDEIPIKPLKLTRIQMIMRNAGM